MSEKAKYRIIIRNSILIMINITMLLVVLPYIKDSMHFMYQQMESANPDFANKNPIYLYFNLIDIGVILAIVALIAQMAYNIIRRTADITARRDIDEFSA